MSVTSTYGFTEREAYRLAQLVNNRAFELIIFPTEKCNFRCTYCYEDFAIGKMKRETINSVKELMKRRVDELDELYLSWFGGEPLLAKDVITELSSYAAELAREHTALSYRGGMTTNGYFLDPPTFSALAKVGLLDYQISLDGPREVHNRTRVKAGGGESFDTIWKNLIAIRATDVPAQITLRVHFSADTLSKIEPLIEEIKREFFADSRFKVYFKSIVRLGGDNDHNIQLLSFEEEQSALKSLKEKLYGGDFLPSKEESYVCYASRPNSLVIRADGRIGKCTVALNDSRNVIGMLRPDGTLALDQKRIQPWLRGLRSMESDILACPLVGLPSE
ncbi:MAG TPA: radical SAM protein [Pyrinomonadaceae bacterium]